MRRASIRGKDSIRIRIPGDPACQEHVSRVESVSEQDLLVSWPEHAGSLIPVRARQVLMISFDRDDIRYEFPATIERTSRDPKPTLTIKQAGAPAAVRSRGDARVPAQLPVQLSPRVVQMSLFKEASRGAPLLSCETVVISGGGFVVHLNQELPPGASFDVRLKLPEVQRPLTMKAKVVRCEHKERDDGNSVTEVELIYTHIAEAARSRIFSHVFKVQRAAVATKSHFGSKEDAVAQIIPENFVDLFQQPAFANLATIMPDGSPQVTPVWCDFDGKHVIVNTARGRVKDRNMRRTPSVALAIMDAKNPYRYLEIRGKVVEITEAGADAHIDKMAKKYLNVDKYPYRQPGEVRVLFKIATERVSSMG